MCHCDALQRLPSALQASVHQLIETLLTSWPAGPKIAPPPTRGRHRPTPADLLAAQDRIAPHGSPVDPMVITNLVPTWEASQEEAVREALKERFPLVASARQVTAQLSLPHVQVRATLLNLARRGIIESPNEGYYRCMLTAEGATHV